jgi:hypothetical protein
MDLAGRGFVCIAYQIHRATFIFAENLTVKKESTGKSKKLLVKTGSLRLKEE